MWSSSNPMPSRLHFRRRQRRNRARMRWKRKKKMLRRQAARNRRQNPNRLTRRETWNSLNLKRGPGRMRKLRGLPCCERSEALWRKRPSAFSNASRSCADKESRTKRTTRLRNSGVASRTTVSRRKCSRRSSGGGDRKRGLSLFLVVQDLREELLRALRARRAEELFLLGVLDDPPRVHEDHAVRHLARESHLVRDHHHGHAFLGELDHHVEHFVDHLGVERRGRLVEQHGDRVHRQRARDRHALLLAAGELAGVLVLVGEQADALEELEPFFRRLADRAPQHLDLAERQVLGHRHVW